MEEERPASPDSPRAASLRQEVAILQSEVERLQRKLHDLHGSDVNALRRAYRTLCQHVQALEEESAGLLEALRRLETEVVTPDLVAQELGTASALAVGLSVVHQALKVTPLAGATWLFRGIWALGGAYVAWRLTAGTLARVAGMLSRNAQRKRQLAAQLEEVEGRIHIMVSLLNWAEARPSPSPSPSPSAQSLAQLQQQAQHAQQAQQVLPSGRGISEPGCGAAAVEQKARSVGSSSPELVAAPAHVLVAGGEGSDYMTPSHSRSPSHSPPKARAEQGGTPAPAAPGTRAGSLPAAAAGGSGGAAGHSRSSSQASLPGSEGGERSSSRAKRAAGGVAGASPSRPDFQVEMEPLRRYAQLGSAGSKPATL